MSGFKKATKAKAKLRAAFFGPSGAGKTFTMLRVATGMGGKIALIDTERGSASKYADRFDFDTVSIGYQDPELPRALWKKDHEAYIEAIKMAQGYGVLIIDSYTHAWQEILEEVDRLSQSKYRGNSWSAWSEGTPKHKALVEAILEYPGHILVSMRSKTAWEQQKDEKSGKTKPVRVGLAPEQRAGVEYEFDLLVELNTDHYAQIIKDRSGKFQDQFIKEPGEDFGRELAEWLEQGEARPAHPAPAQDPTEQGLPPITEDDRTNRRKWRAQVNKAGQGSITLEDIEKYRAYFVEKMGAFFEQFTYHNQVETFRSLLDEHAQRIKDEAQRRSPGAIKDWVRNMQASKTAQDFADFVKVYNRLDYLHSVEVEQELQDTAKAFGFEHYEDAIAEKSA